MSTPPSSPPSRLLDSWAPKRRQSFRPCNFKERKGSIPQEVFLCGCMCVHACTLSLIQLFVTPWTVACQALSVHRIPQAKILEWGAMPSSRGSS